MKESCNVISNNVDQRLCEGFTQFQKYAKFVDMVIAADGCFKKVHRAIIALSSPFLDELINAMPSDNPVLYLHGVKQQTFGYLVQYIYSGYVEIPQDSMDDFVKVVKQLQIKGLENIEYNNYANSKETEYMRTSRETLSKVLRAKRINKSRTMAMDTDELDCNNVQITSVETIPSNTHVNMIDFEETIDSGLSNIELSIQCNSLNSNGGYVMQSLEQAQRLQTNTIDHPVLPDTSCELTNTTGIFNTFTADVDYLNTFEQTSKTGDLIMPQINLTAQGGFSLGTVVVNSQDNGVDSCQGQEQFEDGGDQAAEFQYSKFDDDENETLSPEYTITERGMLQMQLKGYTFYIHNINKKKPKRRWRCTLYRRGGCPAMVETEAEAIIMRMLRHNHDIPTRETKKLPTVYKTIMEGTKALESNSLPYIITSDTD